MHELLSRLSELEIQPNENLGQHFLIENQSLDFIAGQVEPGSRVIEIGSGPGNLTRHLAARASYVTGIELDRRFEPLLNPIQTNSGNVDIVYTDALTFPYRDYIRGSGHPDWQIVGNIPYHITEPLIKRLIEVPVLNIVLMLGDTHARLLTIKDPNNSLYSRSSMLAQTFFQVDKLVDFEPGAFYPPPRTRSTLVSLTPREPVEFAHPVLAIQRELFISENKSPSIAKVVSLALDKLTDQALAGSVSQTKTERRRNSRRSAKMDIRQYLRGDRSSSHILNAYSQDKTQRQRRSSMSLSDLQLPENILSTPFSRLDNWQLRQLASLLEQAFGKPE